MKWSFSLLICKENAILTFTINCDLLVCFHLTVNIIKIWLEVLKKTVLAVNKFKQEDAKIVQFVLMLINLFSGYYCNFADAPITDYTSYICPLGYYCPNGTEFSTQYGCPKGTYGTSTQLESASQCTACDAGKYCESVGMTTTTGMYHY